MKKIRFYLCAVLLICSAAAITACGRNSGNDQSGQSSAAQSSTSGSGAENSEKGGAGTAAGNGDKGSAAGGEKGSTGSVAGSGKKGASAGEESTGVLDGLVDDVEQGIHDMEGDSEGPSNNADESRN